MSIQEQHPGEFDYFAARYILSSMLRKVDGVVDQLQAESEKVVRDLFTRAEKAEARVKELETEIETLRAVTAGQE